MSIDSKSVLYGHSNDENYTPAYGVSPILEYIPKGAVVWCPFDTAESQFVKLISEQNKVEFSHIAMGTEYDFFNYEPKNWDVIVSNPPFKGKREIFQRALSFNKPFALLMTNTWLNDSAPKQLFEKRDLQLLMFDKRIEFSNEKKITFSSSYFCWNFLPKQIVMEKIVK